MYSRNSLGERRLAPAPYKFWLTAHVIVSVAWLGVALAKLVLGLVAARSNNPDYAYGLFAAMEVLNIAFPPLAVSTIISGVLLSLGTKWGLLQHYWVVTKIVLTVGVIATSVQLSASFSQATLAATRQPNATDGSLASIMAQPSTLLLGLTLTHILMLAVATVVSTYKPWGKTFLGKRKPTRSRTEFTALSEAGNIAPARRAQTNGGE